MDCMAVARVCAFLSFLHHITMYECTLVEWFKLVGNTSDPIVRMWIVKPEFIGNRRAVGIVLVESIVC